MGDISLSINGRRVTASAGHSLLAVADAYNIPIPRLCYHPELKPYGACRLCLVEEETSGRLLAACVTPAAADMTIQTDSARVLTHRRRIVRLLMAEHPESCVVCNKGNRCELRLIAARLGIADSGLDAMPNFKPFEQGNPFMTRDLSKCVLCGKCIRADHELVGVGAIDYQGRGFDSRPATLLENPLEASTCTFCGTCAAMCPTGALGLRFGVVAGTPEYEKPSLCGFCAVGCRLLLGVTGNQVVEVNPAPAILKPAAAFRPTITSQTPVPWFLGSTTDAGRSVNGATLCIRGHYAHDYLNSPARLTHPLVKTEDGWQTVAWPGALELTARRLNEIRKQYGAQSIGFVGSPACSTEENYLLQKLARMALGTHNIDHADGLNTQAGIEALGQLTHHGWQAPPLADLAQAESIIIMGADPDQTLPVMAYYLRRARQAGTPVITIHRCPTAFDRNATVHLRLKPSGDGAYAWVLSDLIRRLHQQKGLDAAFTEHRARDVKIFLEHAEALTSDHLESCTGASDQDLAAAARALAGRRIAFVVGSDVLGSLDIVNTLQALLNLSLATGSLNQPGGGIYLEQSDANSTGARLSGCQPHRLPGDLPLTDTDARRYWEKSWHTSLSPDQGLSLRRMLAEAEAGNLKALYIMGANPLRNLPDAPRVQAVLSRLELLVVQDILHTVTADAAHIILPGAAFSEKAGTLINLEGRCQPLAPVVDPPVEARADWWILTELLQRLLPDHPLKTLEDTQHEMARSIPGYAINGPPLRTRSRYGPFRSDGTGEPLPLQWPHDTLSEAQPATPSSSLHAFIVYPRHHLGGGTRTAHSPRIQHWEQQLPLTRSIVLHPSDAQRLNLTAGTTVEVRTATGSIHRDLHLDPHLTPGSAVLYAGSKGNDVLNLLSWEDNTQGGVMVEVMSGYIIQTPKGTNP